MGDTTAFFFLVWVTQDDVKQTKKGWQLILDTWNVRGLNNPVKTGTGTLSRDVFFLQETHLNKNEYMKLRCRWTGQSYHASCAVRTRGVAIPFKKSTPFIHKSTFWDWKGRYPILVGQLYFLHIILSNITGSSYITLIRTSFYQHILAQIPDILQTNLIIGGDLNLELDTYLDHSSSCRSPASNASVILLFYLKKFNLLDSWRIFNSQERAYMICRHELITSWWMLNCCHILVM